LSSANGTSRILAANVGKLQISCGCFRDGLRGAADEAQRVSAFAPMTNLRIPEKSFATTWRQQDLGRIVVVIGRSPGECFAKGSEAWIPAGA
jgi:hypothetical protein